MPTGLLDGVPETGGRERILTPDVDVAAIAPGRVPGDRERLDHRERILLHDDAVLERSRLGFVGVADEVVRPDRLLGDGLPFHPRGERRSPTPHELGVGDLSDHAVGAECVSPPQGVVATVRPIVVDRGRVGQPHPSEQAEPVAPTAVPCLRRGDDGRIRRSRELGTGLRAREHAPDLTGRRVPQRRVLGAGTRALDQHGGRALAHPQAGAPHPGGCGAVGRLAGSPDGSLELGAERVPADPAREVVTDVDDRLRTRFHAEHRVERGDAVGLGRGNGEPLTDVGESALADPPDPGLKRVEGGEQQVPLLPGGAAAPREPPLGAGLARPSDPARLRRAEQVVDGGALLVGRRRRHQMQIHGAPVIPRPGRRAGRRARAPASRA